MTRIDGYVAEKDDVILWGRNEPKAAELQFDDLVIAIRSVTGEYGPAVPGVSLDFKPDPGLGIRESKTKARDRINSIPLKNDDEFKTVCKELNGYTRVNGMPDNSQTARDLLDADYEMKKVSNGRGTLKIKNLFPSKYFAQLEGRKRQIEQDSSISFEGGSRLWFTPGRMSYLQDETSVFLDCVQVVLTEESYLGGGIVTSNPYNQAFTCAWTNRMDEIVRSDPIWRRLHDIFRMFALARVLDKTDVIENLDDRRILWYKYHLPEVDIPEQYPPVVRIDRFNLAHKVWTSRVCGGVRIPHEATKKSPDPITDATRSDINLVSKKALESMHSCEGKSCWNIE